jgi:hypothetical protein
MPGAPDRRRYDPVAPSDVTSPVSEGDRRRRAKRTPETMRRRRARRSRAGAQAYGPRPRAGREGALRAAGVARRVRGHARRPPARPRRAQPVGRAPVPDRRLRGEGEPRRLAARARRLPEVRGVDGGGRRLLRRHRPQGDPERRAAGGLGPPRARGDAGRIPDDDAAPRHGARPRRHPPPRGRGALPRADGRHAPPAGPRRRVAGAHADRGRDRASAPGSGTSGHVRRTAPR